MTISRIIYLFVFGILSLAWIGFLIWLLSLIIRALKKYLKTEDVRNGTSSVLYYIKASYR